MLDIEVAVPPTQVGTDILPVATLKQRMRITHSRLDSVLEDCINEAADKLHGLDGELNRTIFPTTYKRWMSKFPNILDTRGNIISTGRGVILLPYPNLIDVVEIAIEDGSSPTTVVDEDDYVVRTGTMIGEIELKVDASWPTYVEGPRAISITYEAGYEEYPPKLKRFVSLLAAHYFENSEATINEPRALMINRRIDFGIEDLRKALRVPVSYDDWNE